MRIVWKFLVISVILGVLLAFIAYSFFAEARIFDCDTEVCSYNGNTSKWDCQYLNCPVMPSWINYTNTTYINTTQVNVTSCNISEMESYWDSYVGRIDKRFNFSVDLEECQDSLRSCRNELDTSSNMLVGMVNQSLLYQCQTDATAARKQAQEVEAGGWYKLLGGFVVGAGIVYFVTRKPEAERSKFMTTPGDMNYNSRAINNDVMSRKSELEKIISKVKGKGEA